MSPFAWLAIGVSLYVLILLLVIGMFVGGNDEGFTWPDDPPEQR